MDSACVIYHFAQPGYIPPPTRLINLGMPNGSSAEAIFERIDAFLVGNKPWTIEDTDSVDLTLNQSSFPIVLSADVKISSASGNTIVINPDGLFSSPFTESGKVKVSAIDIPKYLEDAVVGGTDGCVSLSITRDTSTGLLFFQPSIDVDCFSNILCNSTSAKNSLAECLLSSGLDVEDTNSVDLTLNESGFPIVLSADVKISSASGNTIVINPDGLFTEGSSFVINNPINNGLITSNGSSDSADAESTILYSNGTLNAPLFNYNFQVVASQEYDRALFIGQLTLSNPNYGVKVSNIAGEHDQLYINTQVNTTFGRGHFIGSGISELVLNSVGGTTTTGLLSSVVAKIDVFNSDDYTQIASIRTQYPGTDNILGGLYSGTITNYYGVFIGDTNGDEGGIAHGRVTNSYAIFQEGSTLLNSFATAVVVTSDERVKTNIEDYKKGLTEIENLRIVKYNFKEAIDAEKKVGVIAQEVEQFIPEAIHTSKNEYYKIEDFKKLDNDTLVYTLINAVKELSSINKDLNSRLKALENK